jgi:ribosomal protein S18 acetylase RimI-like enzyme
VFDALDSVTRSCYRSFLPLPNASLIDDGEVYGVITAVPLGFFNGIATTRFRERERIDDIVALYRERNRGFRWWVTPDTRPAGLDTILQERGFTHAYDSLGMTADLAQLRSAKPSELRIEQVRNEAEMSVFTTVLTTVFNSPEDHHLAWLSAYRDLGFGDDAQWVHFLGYLGNMPVATTSVMIDGDLAGIYLVGTLAAARGRGAGSTLTLHAMQHARDRGARTAALQSSEMGESVYRGIGFVPGATLRLYDWRPA